jgi:UTP--glucose-1-phosphate uridylyltransferase
MTDVYNQTGGNVIAVQNVPREETKRYGTIAPGAEKNGTIEIKGIVEKPDPAKAPSTLCVIGRYILTPDVFNELERKEIGAGGEIQLTDALARLIGKQPFHGFRFDGQRYDCGDKVGFLQANIAVGLSRPDIAGPLRDMIKSLKL